jgi:hypothetical protein
LWVVSRLEKPCHGAFRLPYQIGPAIKCRDSCADARADEKGSRVGSQGQTMQLRGVLTVARTASTLSLTHADKPHAHDVRRERTLVRSRREENSVPTEEVLLDDIVP